MAGTVTVNQLVSLSRASLLYDDLVPIFDAHDFTQSPQGSLKQISVTNLFTTPTFTGLITGTAGLTIAGAVTFANNIVMTAASSKLIPGTTAWSLRNNADTASNIAVTDAGLVTLRNTLTLSAGNLSLGADGAELDTTFAGVTTTRLKTDATGGLLSVDGANPLRLRTNGVDRITISGAGTVTFSAGIVAGGSNFSGALAISSGGLNVTGGIVVAGGSLALSGGANITGTAPFTGNVTVAGTLGVTGQATFAAVNRVTGAGNTGAAVAAWRLGDNNSGSSRDWGISNGYAAGAADIGALSFAASAAANGDPLAGTGNVILRLTTGSVTIGAVLLPDVTATRDLGSTGTRWNSLYLAAGIVAGGSGAFGTTLAVTGLSTLNKIKGTGSSGFAVQAGAGTGATCAMPSSSNDMFGEVRLTTGSAPTANADWVYVTYAVAYTGTAPFPAISPTTSSGALANLYVSSYTTSGFTVAGQTAVAGNPCFFTYHVGQ